MTSYNASCCIFARIRSNHALGSASAYPKRMAAYHADLLQSLMSSIDRVSPDNFTANPRLYDVAPYNCDCVHTHVQKNARKAVARNFAPAVPANINSPKAKFSYHTQPGYPTGVGVWSSILIPCPRQTHPLTSKIGSLRLVSHHFSCLASYLPATACDIHTTHTSKMDLQFCCSDCTRSRCAMMI